MNTSQYRFTLDLQSTQSQISIPVTREKRNKRFETLLKEVTMPPQHSFRRRLMSRRLRADRQSPLRSKSQTYFQSHGRKKRSAR